jgi:hypothetical protein
LFYIQAGSLSLSKMAVGSLIVLLQVLLVFFDYHDGMRQF